jgi:hypothetical protein
MDGLSKDIKERLPLLERSKTRTVRRPQVNLAQLGKLCAGTSTEIRKPTILVSHAPGCTKCLIQRGFPW